MNKPKYEKPVVEDLSEVQIAEGDCGAGYGVGTIPNICGGGPEGMRRGGCASGSSASQGCITGPSAG